MLAPGWLPDRSYLTCADLVCVPLGVVFERGWVHISLIEVKNKITARRIETLDKPVKLLGTCSLSTRCQPGPWGIVGADNGLKAMTFQPGCL